MIPNIADPLILFETWLRQAEKSEINDPNAMALATVNKEGQPSVRMVLLKGYGKDGFTFYTNSESHKGEDLTGQPKAGLCLYWKSLKKQVRIEGKVEWVSDEEADAYFKTRPRMSRIGAWASKQSRPLPKMDVLKKALADYDEKYPGDAVPRPPHWNGYRVIAHRIEFWQEQPFRLHDRLVFERSGQGWRTHRLYP